MRSTTISEVRYGDARITTPAAAQGTVILTEKATESMRDPNFQGDPWIGTAQGGETVGNRIVVEKRPTLYRFAGRGTLVLTPEGYEERQELRATRNVGDLHNLYFFMHPWVPSSRRWLAGCGDGNEVFGDFKDGMTVSLHRDYEYRPQCFALYDPVLRLGILQYTPQRIPGSSLVLDRPNYKKHHTVLPVKDNSFLTGDVISHRVFVRVIEDETGDWFATRRALEQLRKLADGRP